MADPAPPATQPTGPLRLAVVNDYEVIVAGVANMLGPYADRVLVTELDVDHDPDHPVDVALFDTYGQPSLGLARIRSLAGRPAVGAVVVYTWTVTEAGRIAAREAGARGLVAKALPASRLVEALEVAASGRWVESGGFRGSGLGHWPGGAWGLSARESETLALLAVGMTNRAIAQALFVSENTVRSHLKAVFRKLRVTTRSQAVARALTDASFAVRHPGTDARDEQAGVPGTLMPGWPTVP